MSEQSLVTANGTVPVKADDPRWLYGPPGTYDVHFEPDLAHERLWTGEIAKVVTGLGKRSKIGLVGFSEASKLALPWLDEEWALCSLNQHYRHQPRASYWFEIHTREQYLSDTVPGTDYLAWLQTCPVPIYVTELYPDMPTAILWPREAILDLGANVWEEKRGQFVRRDYNQSSLSAMLGWALVEGFDTIGIWGVDLIIGTEYHYQKPSMEWLLGFAQGMGYTVTRGTKPRGMPREIFIPETSALLHQNYSYGPQTAADNPLRAPMVDRQEVIAHGQKEIVDTLNKIDGELHANLQWITVLEGLMSGKTVKWTNADQTTRDLSGDPLMILDLLRERQQQCLTVKQQFLEQFQQAEGAFEAIQTWLTFLEMQDRGARPQYKYRDGRVEFLKSLR